MLKEGRVAFFGTTTNVSSYFENQVGIPLPPQTNCADWLMDILTGAETTPGL